MALYHHEPKYTYINGKLIVDDANIMFRNFAGKETKYNRDGNRNFCVEITDKKLAQVLSDDGWNVRTLRPRDEDDESTDYVQVSVSFRNIPPDIYLVANGVKTKLTEETIGELDYAEIRHVDLSVRPYYWEVNDKSGIKGYAKTMYVTIEEDEFAARYAEEEYPGEEDIPEF